MIFSGAQDAFFVGLNSQFLDCGLQRHVISNQSGNVVAFRCEHLLKLDRLSFAGAIHAGILASVVRADHFQLDAGKLDGGVDGTLESEA